MKWHRIYAILLRHVIQLPQDVNQWTSIFFWPLINIMLFGTTGQWLHTTSSETLFALVTGVALWQLAIRINFGISLGFLQEIFSRNVTNLFSSPLRIGEWVCAMLLHGLILGSLTASFCMWVVWMIFGINILSLGWYLVYTLFQIYIAGASLGFLGTSLLMLWGTKVQTIIFMIGVAAAPLSGAFYPIDMLPNALQYLAYALPFSHIFTGLFIYIQSGMWSHAHIMYATLLNSVFFTVAISCVIMSFYISKNTGFKETEE